MVAIDTTFVYHFIDPDLGVEIFFEKAGTREKGELRHLCKLVLGVEEKFTQNLSAFSSVPKKSSF